MAASSGSTCGQTSHREIHTLHSGSTWDLTCVDQHQSAEKGQLVFTQLQSTHVMSKVKYRRDQIATACRSNKPQINCLFLIISII